MTIGERIKEGRKSKGLTQQQLSHMSGVGRATIARCELGTTPPTFSTIEKIARALSVDTEALVSGEGWKVKTPKTIGARVRAAREKKKPYTGTIGAQNRGFRFIRRQSGKRFGEP